MIATTVSSACLTRQRQTRLTSFSEARKPEKKLTAAQEYQARKRAAIAKSRAHPELMEPLLDTGGFRPVVEGE